MINPYVRQHIAYCLAGSNNAYWNTEERAPASPYSTALVYHKASAPPYTPMATQQWPCMGTVSGAYGGTDWATRRYFGTMSTLFASVIYFSYAWHVASYGFVVEDMLADYAVAFSTYFPVRRNNPITSATATFGEVVFFNDYIVVRDTGSVILPNMGGRLLWGNVSGDNDDIGGWGPGGWIMSGFSRLRVFDFSLGTFFDATLSANSIAANGTVATCVFRGRTTQVFNPSEMQVQFGWNYGGAEASLAVLTQDNDPLWFVSGQELGHWEQIGSGDQFLATLKFHVLEGSSNSETA